MTLYLHKIMPQGWPCQMGQHGSNTHAAMGRGKSSKVTMTTKPELEHQSKVSTVGAVWSSLSPSRHEQLQ